MNLSGAPTPIDGVVESISAMHQTMENCLSAILTAIEENTQAVKALHSDVVDIQRSVEHIQEDVA